MTAHVAPTEPAAISWHWSFFLLGLVYAVPAMAVTPLHPVAGLGLAVGVMPVAAFNLPMFRRGRRIIPAIGAVSAGCFVAGSLLAQNAIVAVVGMFVLAMGFTLWARTSRAGVLALLLCLPMIGIALSLTDVILAAFVAGLVLLGSLYGWGVAMLWPEHQIPAPVRDGNPSRTEAVTYGILLGGAAASATAIGFVTGAEHVGWATGTALLIMRPVRHRLVRRSIRRAGSVIVGAFGAAAFVLLSPAPWLIAIVVGLVIAALSATQASRWYIAPAFTSFIALTLILQAPGELPAARFAERVIETGIGVGVALFFGALIPALIGLYRQRQTKGIHS